MMGKEQCPECGSFDLLFWHCAREVAREVGGKFVAGELFTCNECGCSNIKDQRWYTVLAQVCAECWYYEDGGLGKAWCELPDGPGFYTWDLGQWRTSCDLFRSRKTPPGEESVECEKEPG